MKDDSIKKNYSVWSHNSKLPQRDGLAGDIKTGVLVIGGGMAGILCAYMLKKAGVDYTLVEAATKGFGITKNTTAKITSQHGLIYHKLLKRFGSRKTLAYLRANQAAVNMYREIAAKIDCDFQEKDSFAYTIDDRKKLLDEMEALSAIGFPAKLEERLPLPFSVSGAVRFSGQAQFNPLKFIGAISGDLNIYENTVVRELVGGKAVTNGGTITADKIIVATHFPFINKHGGYFVKLYQHRSYVLALENAADVGGMYVDDKQTGMSFRNYNNLLLVGGGDHRTGKTGGSWQELYDFAKKYYPNATPRYRWATQDCMTLDDVPYIGQYSGSTQDFYVATGFNKWGMTSSMVAAMLLTDLVRGKENQFSEVFSPSRSILRPQLLVNAAQATANLLTISKPRCPHMGCALKWNKNEQTWDCPCHGSRFDEQGQLIDNPSTGNLKS